MDRETLAASAAAVLMSCGIESTPKPGTQGLEVIINGTQFEIVTAVWSRLTYALSERHLISGAHQVSLQQYGPYQVLCVAGVPIVFRTSDTEVPTELDCPRLIEPVTVALGGGSGSGKTTIANRLKQLLPGYVFTYPAFTNRPRRPSEREGVDYYFRSDTDLASARLDPRYSNFVEARGFWYWTDASRLLRSIWQHPQAIHLFFISQLHDLAQRKLLFPSLKWIWLDIPEPELRRRLLLNPDRDLESSMRYNRRLIEQDKEGLVDLTVTNEMGHFDEAVAQIMSFCETLQQERSRQCGQS